MCGIKGRLALRVHGNFGASPQRDAPLHKLIREGRLQQCCAAMPAAAAKTTADVCAVDSGTLNELA